MIENSKGQVFYGLHFVPGVAEYQESDGSSFRIFINEDTIRRMNPSFAVKPVFVDHVDGVDDDINKVRTEADGWVVESFFNAADGKTWVKFIIVSDRGLEAIRRGFRLSNAYFPKSFASGGVWNGVEYQKEIIDGEYEHLAIVQQPRYDESLILNPDQFKKYNEEKTENLKRLSNSKNDKGETNMKLNIFKRQKVENSLDLENMMVELPKSKKEVLLSKVVNDYDAILNMNGYANDEHMVKLNDKEEMSVKDLVKKHMEACNELDEMKKKNAKTDEGGEPGKGADDEMMNEDMDEDMSMDNEALDIDQMGDVGDRGGDKSLDNEDDEEMKKKDKDMEAKKKNTLARAKAAALKNANNRAFEQEVARIDLPQTQVARGKARYGSGN